MAAQGRPVSDSTYTESRVYGLSEDAVLAVLPQVLAQALGETIQNPLPGCYTAHMAGMPGREIIVRVEPEESGTRVRLDVRPWQDQRIVAAVILGAMLVFPMLIFLVWQAARMLLTSKPVGLPPEVLAHGVFRGLSSALGKAQPAGYRIAASGDAHMGRLEEAGEEEEQVPGSAPLASAHLGGRSRSGLP